MNDIQQTLVRSVLKVGTGYLLAHGLTNSSQAEELSAALVGVISVLWGVFHRAGPAMADSKPMPGKGTPLMALLLLSALAGLAGEGCAPLAPGADPVVVRAQQLEASAKSSFDAFLQIDYAGGPLLASNAPAVHQFANWLRQPQSVALGGTNVTLPRDLAYVVGLDNVIQAYRSGKATSNDVATAMLVISSAVSQSTQFMASLTNSPSTAH